jgi:hypothetical protein
MIAFGILVVYPEGKRPLGIPKCRWLVIIKMYVGYDRVVWTGFGSG